MRRFAFLLLFAPLIAFVAGCASVPRAIVIPAQQLQAALERRFPYEARPGGLFIVRVTAPQLHLLPEDDRLRLDFSVDAMDRIARHSTHAELVVSFGLRYEPSDASIRAVAVRLEDIAVQGAPRELQAPLQTVGALVANTLLEGAVLHAFRAEDIAKARGWTPRILRVTPTGVLIELQPPD